LITAILGAQGACADVPLVPGAPLRIDRIGVRLSDQALENIGVAKLTRAEITAAWIGNTVAWGLAGQVDAVIFYDPVGVAWTSAGDGSKTVNGWWFEGDDFCEGSAGNSMCSTIWSAPQGGDGAARMVRAVDLSEGQSRSYSTRVIPGDLGRRQWRGRFATVPVEITIDGSAARSKAQVFWDSKDGEVLGPGFAYVLDWPASEVRCGGRLTRVIGETPRLSCPGGFSGEGVAGAPFTLVDPSSSATVVVRFLSDRW
jgi:hypothetical protein